MKKAVAGAFVLAALAVAGIVARQTIQRDRDYRRLIDDGDNALVKGDTFVAIEAFSGAIALKPESMRAYLKRAEAHERRSGDSRETLSAALRDLRAAAELDPGATRVQEQLGDVNYQLHRYPNAIESYEAYLRLDDRSPTIFYKLGLALRADGRQAAAIAALRNAIKLHATFAEAHYALGLCFKDSESLPNARASFERAVTIAPALIPAREELVDVYRTLGRRRDEMEQLTALAALEPRRADRRVSIALAHARNGNFDGAMTELAGALQRFRRDPALYAAIGKVWLDAVDRRGDPAGVRKAVEALEPLASTTNSSEVLGLYGKALALDGQYEDAEQILKDAARLFPVYPDVLPELAAVSEHLGHTDDARAALFQYVSLVDDDRDRAAHAEKIGDLSLALNDPSTGLSWYRRAEASGAPSAGMLAHMADAQSKLGQREAAQATLARAAAKDPNDPVVREVRRRVRLPAVAQAP
jgi:tetratricopeptide (TPR) repeat protein